MKALVNGLLFCILPILFIIYPVASLWASESASQHIHDNWQYKQVGRLDQWRNAKVPGTVHTDLIRDGVIPDPFYFQNEKAVQWVEHADWEYKTTFKPDAKVFNHQRLELVFEGLDTYASVYLNDRLILEADNMFRTWRVDVSKLLNEGENTLYIRFKSPIRAGMERRSNYRSYYPDVNEQAPKAAHTSTYIRKAPYHYGWDWGPRLVTSGIYKSVRLEGSNEVKIRDLHWQQGNFSTKLVDGKAIVQLRTDRKTKVNLTIKADGQVMGRKVANLDTGTHQLVVPLAFTKPRIWWPNGLGDHPLYKLEAVAETEDENIDRRSTTIGLAQIKLIRKLDQIGRSFYFEVNGKPCFMKGANYLPPTHFVNTLDSSAYYNVVKQAVNSNMNMFRIWGGAVYADDMLYKACAENGIMLWNEFMFACAAYPGDDAFVNSIRAEATDNIIRVRNWPNIAIWSGNNENINGVRGWFRNRYKSGESDSLELETAFQRIFYKELKERMETLAPHIPYWGTSPQSKDMEKENLTEGDNHFWDVYFGKKLFDEFDSHTGRFVSEYGIQSFPALSLFKKVELPEELYLGSVALKHRQRSPVWLDGKQQSGNEAIIWYTEKYFKPVKRFDHQVYTSQLMQSLCLKSAIEAHRRQMNTCGGTMYWQINDTWPCTSWSTIDYFGTWKAAQYQVKNHYREVLPVVHNNGKNFDVYVASDLRTASKATLEIRLIDLAGKVLLTAVKAIDLQPLSSKVYYTLNRKDWPAGTDKENVALQIVVKAGKKELGSNIHYFVKPAELQLTNPSVERIINPVDGGYRIELTARNVVKNYYLYTKNGEGHFSDNFIDLMPGQKVVVNLTGVTLASYNDEILSLSLFETLADNK